MILLFMRSSASLPSSHLNCRRDRFACCSSTHDAVIRGRNGYTRPASSEGCAAAPRPWHLQQGRGRLQRRAHGEVNRRFQAFYLPSRIVGRACLPVKLTTRVLVDLGKLSCGSRVLPHQPFDQNASVSLSGAKTRNSPSAVAASRGSRIRQ